MSYEEFLKGYEQNNIFYLYGREDFFVEDFIGRARSGLISDFRDFNFDLIDLSFEGYDACVLRLRSIPMMDSHRVVVIKNFSCKESKECVWSKEEKEGFADFLKSLGSDVKVILVACSNDKSTKVFKSISSVALVFESIRLDHLSLTRHVLGQFHLHGLSVERSLAEFYVSICGYLNRESLKSVNEVNSEVAKLCSFVSSGEVLTKASIEEIVVRTNDYNVFALLDCAFRGDRERSLSLFESLVGNEVHPMMIFSLLCSSVGLLGKCLLLSEKGMGVDMMAKELKENPFRVKNVVNNGRRFSRRSASLLLNDLIDLDFRYKRGLLTDNVIGHLAIMRITR